MLNKGWPLLLATLSDSIFGDVAGALATHLT
jgi:hypothetical protein